MDESGGAAVHAATTGGAAGPLHLWIIDTIVYEQVTTPA